MKRSPNKTPRETPVGAGWPLFVRVRTRAFIAILILSIVVFLSIFLYGSALAERNARFVHVMNDLRFLRCLL